MGLAVLTGTPPGNRPRSKDEGLRFFLLLRHETGNLGGVFAPAVPLLVVCRTEEPGDR